MSNVTPFPMLVADDATQTVDVTKRALVDEVPARTFHFWRGASDRRYVHIVHSLIECPELEASNYILVHVDACGRRTPLKIGRTTSIHGSENLAEIRRHAARLGASEVHHHVVPDSVHAQAVTQWDLQAAHFGAIVSEESDVACHKTVGVS